MFIRLRELISVSCQSMAHIARYVNLLQEPYVLSRYTFQIATPVEEISLTLVWRPH